MIFIANFVNFEILNCLNSLGKWVRKPMKWSYKLEDDGNAVLIGKVCIDRVIRDHDSVKNQFYIIRKSRDETVSICSKKLKMIRFSQIHGPANQKPDQDRIGENSP